MITSPAQTSRRRSRPTALKGLAVTVLGALWLVSVSSGGLESSDGRVAFAAKGAIIVVRPDGSGRRVIAKDGEPGGDGYVSSPAWTADGKLLTYLVGGRANDQVAVARNADGSGRRMLWIDAYLVFSALSWSPDGRAAVYEYVNDVPGGGAFGGLVYSARRGATPRKLTRTPPKPNHIWDSGPDWSPDGRTIAFARDPTGEGYGAPTSLFTVGVQGGQPHRLVPGSEPDWSPDGRRIAFVRGGAVLTVRANGSGVRRVTTRVGASSPAFSPDGRWIAFASRNGVWVARTDGQSAPRWIAGDAAGGSDSVDWG